RPRYRCCIAFVNDRRIGRWSDWKFPDASCTLAKYSLMANFNLKDRTAIVGVGNSQYGRRLMRSAVDLAADAIANALDDSGLTRDQLDGMIVSFGSPIGADSDTIAQLLGLKLRTCNQTWAHGRFTASSIIWAAMLVNAGMADAVACLASVSFSSVRRPMMG